MNNIYYAAAGGIVLIARQSRPTHVADMNRAADEMSVDTRFLFCTTTMSQVIESANRPLFTNETIDYLHLNLMIDNEVIGFATLRFEIIEGERWARSGVGLVDKWQRHGVGTLYGYLSEYIARKLGAVALHGVTWPQHGRGMYQIRLRSGFKQISSPRYQDSAHIMKRLVPRPEEVN